MTAAGLGEAQEAQAAPRAVFCVAGTSSGVGKSSMVVGIAAALRERGLTVQAFKVGPDFIDPMHHEAATGRPSINLDSWMLSREQVLAAFHRAAAGADVAVVEGVMGLFDGRDGATEQGSTAQLAKWLGAPVVLVLDASALARSAAAVTKGYAEFDPGLRLAGVLFNKVGGPAHTRWLADALAASGIQAAVLGGVPKSAEVAVPERALGLHLPGDDGVPADLVASLARLVAEHVDLDALLELGASAEVPPPPPDTPTAPEPAPPADGEAAAEQVLAPALVAEGEAADTPAQSPQRAQSPPQAQPSPQAQSPPPAQQQAGDEQRPVRIAVARDAAFCFYYHDNLALLRQAGAELAFFSPLADPLPPDCAGLYIGGGYPERHAAELADNRVLRASVAAFARAGGVVYAECGGLMYLSRSIQPAPEEPARPMAGVFPFKTLVSESSMTMGYVEVETLPGCPLFPPGRRVRGQVYHFSEIVQESVVAGRGKALASGRPAGEAAPWATCYRVQAQIPGAAEVDEGFCTGAVLASYVHLHFGSCPDFAASLVRRCRGVDVAGVGAAVAEAAQTAAYLEGAVASLHSTPRSAAKGGRPVPHCRSSPDFARDERLAAKQRLAAGEGAPHRGHSDDPMARHHPPLPAGEGGLHYRHTSLPQPGGGPRSASPAATLSKVVSMGSLSSCSPHIGVGQLPQGEVLSPPLSDSPQQLSPRELDGGGGHACFGAGGQPHAHAQHHGAAPQHHGGHYGAHAQHHHHHVPPVPPLPLEALGGGYGGPPHRQQPAGGGLGQQSGWGSWPHLHAPHVPPPIVNGRPGSGSAFAAAAQQQLYAQQLQQYGQQYGQQQPQQYYPPPGSAWPPPGGRHSRSSSYDRPPSGGGAPPLLPARSPSGLDLPAALEPRALAMSATPYAWQHSAAPSDKIVSLSPGATEMLWALGLGARVAAVSDACDYPPDAVARAKARRSFAAPSSRASSLGHASASTSAPPSRRESPVGAARGAGAAAWQAAGSGGASPRGRCACAQHGAGACAQHAQQAVEFVVDEEVLARERPGLVVYEERQERALCAAGSAAGGALLGGGGRGMGAAVLEALLAVGLQQCCRVVCVRRRTLSDVLDSMLVVGEAAGVQDEALRTVDRLRARLRRVAGEAAGAAAAAGSHPRVLVLQSLRPLRTLGWWLPDQATLAGGACWPQEQAGDLPCELTWEQVQAFAPEVLVVAGMSGGSALGPLTDLCHVASMPGWWLLPAVRASAVFVTDAALFCRPGPRLVEGVECLARMLWDDAAPGCAVPDRAVLKLSLRPGQRCRPRLLPNHFVPFASE